MTSEERKALRTLARAVRDGEAALEVIRAAKLDEVQPVSGLIAKLRALREVSEHRRALMEDVTTELAAVGVDELRAKWPSFASVGAQVLAMLGR